MSEGVETKRRLEIKIRHASSHDLAALAELEAAVFMPPSNRPWSIEQIRSEQRDGRLMLSAFDADQLVGYALFLHLGPECELLRIAVSPAARRRSIARQLLRYGLRELTEGSAEVCYLEVRADNQPAMAFYTAEGFENCGRRKAYYPDGCDAFSLTKPMTAA